MLEWGVVAYYAVNVMVVFRRLIFSFALLFCVSDYANSAQNDKYKYIQDAILNATREIMKHTYDVKEGVYHKDNLKKKSKKAYNYTLKKVVENLESDVFDIYEMLAGIIYDLFCKDHKGLTVEKIRKTQGFAAMVEAFHNYFAHNYIDKMAISQNMPLTGWSIKVQRMTVGRRKVYIELETETQYSHDTLTSVVKWVVKKPGNLKDKIVVLDLQIDGLSFRDSQTAQWRGVHNSDSKELNPKHLVKDLTKQFKAFKPDVKA